MAKSPEHTPLGGTRQLRRWHRARILQAIRAEAGISRLRLARKLGLSPSAVTEVVAELLNEGLLTERPTPHRPGPPLGGPRGRRGAPPGAGLGN